MRKTEGIILIILITFTLLSSTVSSQIYTPPSHIISQLIIQVNTDKTYYYEGEIVKINVNIKNLFQKRIEIKSEEINVYLISLFGDFKLKLETKQRIYLI